MPHVGYFVNLVFTLVRVVFLSSLPFDSSCSLFRRVFTFPSLSAPSLPLRGSFRLSCLLCLRQTKGGGEKKNNNSIDMKVLPARRAPVYSFLNLNYLEQKHCCLKSAFSGAYSSRLPLTQDWLPFFGLTRPHTTPLDPLIQTTPPSAPVVPPVLQGCGGCGRCQRWFSEEQRLAYEGASCRRAARRPAARLPVTDKSLTFQVRPICAPRSQAT